MLFKIYLHEFEDLVNNFRHLENKVDIRQLHLGYALVFLVPKTNEQFLVE